MKREKILYTVAIALLAVALVAALIYKRPLDIRQITGVAEPETISLHIERLDPATGLKVKELTLSAGDEGFDALLGQLDELEFRRPPANLFRIALPFLGDADSGEKDCEDGQFRRLDVTLSASDWAGEYAPNQVSFQVDQWYYRDSSRSQTLALAVVDGEEIGQDLCAQLWEQAQWVNY